MSSRKFGKHGYYHYDSSYRTKKAARKRIEFLWFNPYKGIWWNARMTKRSDDEYVVWVKRRKK